MTLEELRQRVERAEWDCKGLDQDADEAETEVWRAQAAGDAELERLWRERAERRRAAADRAYDRLMEAEEALAQAEYEAENPEEAAAERAAAAEEAAKGPLLPRLVRAGVISQETLDRLFSR